MKVELNYDTVDEIVLASLDSMYKDTASYIEKRKAGEAIFAMYSFDDLDADLKKTEKLLKALKRVHNYYAKPANRI